MPRYIEVDAERLSKLHEGIELIESVDREAFRNLDLHVYGITNNPQIIDAAKEAIAEDSDVAEQDVQLAEVAVAIPLSSDIIYYLTGSGLTLRREEFAYMGSGGEGVRTMSFAFSHYRPKVVLNYFSKLAVASSVNDLYDFLRKEGSNKPAMVTQNVRRTEEATQPGIPAPEQPAAPQQPATAPQAQMPKQTSLLGGLKLSDVLDEFLS
jgi:hypothetical protein